MSWSNSGGQGSDDSSRSISTEAPPRSKPGGHQGGSPLVHVADLRRPFVHLQVGHGLQRDRRYAGGVDVEVPDLVDAVDLLLQHAHAHVDTVVAAAQVGGHVALDLVAHGLRHGQQVQPPGGEALAVVADAQLRVAGPQVRAHVAQRIDVRQPVHHVVGRAPQLRQVVTEHRHLDRGAEREQRGILDLDLEPRYLQPLADLILDVLLEAVETSAAVDGDVQVDGVFALAQFGVGRSLGPRGGLQAC
jgi:hypothetical protein